MRVCVCSLEWVPRVCKQKYTTRPSDFCVCRVGTPPARYILEIQIIFYAYKIICIITYHLEIPGPFPLYEKILYGFRIRYVLVALIFQQYFPVATRVDSVAQFFFAIVVFLFMSSRALRSLSRGEITGLKGT